MMVDSWEARVKANGERAVQEGYEKYLRGTKDNPLKTIEEYKKMRDEEELP
jgi:hypothetical protein